MATFCLSGQLNGVCYRNETLDMIVRPYFHAFEHQNHILTQSQSWKQYNTQQIIISFNHLAQAPDLKPDENVWNFLQRKANGRQPLVSTLAQFLAAWVQEWSRNPTAYLSKLVRSMPKRCQVVIQTRGSHTPYWLKTSHPWPQWTIPLDSLFVVLDTQYGFPEFLQALFSFVGTWIQTFVMVIILLIFCCFCYWHYQICYLWKELVSLKTVSLKHCSIMTNCYLASI